ncbi:MAG: MarR family winged helix-turn-helix transcriptional regulator [Gammaproteobacteria bacterium]
MKEELNNRPEPASANNKVLPKDPSEAMIVALRRVIRAVDLHSKRLVHSHGLTGPQAMVLKEVVGAGRLVAGELARRISLSQATVTDIVKRMEGRGFLVRERSPEDRRKVFISATEQGREAVRSAPPLLQETFSERFSALKDWEQSLLLSSVQRVAELMDAESLDASPVLSSGSVAATPQAVEQVVAAEFPPSENKLSG